MYLNKILSALSAPFAQLAEQSMQNQYILLLKYQRNGKWEQM